MTEAPRKTILVMDDSEILRDIARYALEAAGYAVITAGTLDELEDRRARSSPDLIVMDVQMPESFGDDVAAVLKAVRGVKAPILLFSSMEEDELSERARYAQVEGFVSKSAGIEALVDRIQALLGER
jgi:DNA-binding response OmpR family regulator